jgi:hypothetical protein
LAGWFRRTKKEGGGGPAGSEQWLLAAQFAARARWITHVCDFLGDPAEERAPNPGMELPGRPEFRVLEFAPRSDRAYWTYLTAGLSLAPQPAGGPMPYLELIAYSSAREPRVADFLFMASHDVASATKSDPPFQAYDLWAAEVHGMSNFLLAPAREPAELLDFPNRARRPEDERYLLATTGRLDGEMHLDLLNVVPLSHEEWRIASEEGSQALLARIGWERQPKTYGWAALRPSGG